jgi:hypothetical protein
VLGVLAKEDAVGFAAGFTQVFPPEIRFIDLGAKDQAAKPGSQVSLANSRPGPEVLPRPVCPVIRTPVLASANVRVSFAEEESRQRGRLSGQVFGRLTRLFDFVPRWKNGRILSTIKILRAIAL